MVDTRPIKRLALIPLLLIAAGCGSASSAGTAPPTTTSTTPKPQPVDPSQLVLTLGEVPVGNITLGDHTGRLSFAEAAKNDPAALKRVERRAYKGGYEAMFVSAAGSSIYSAVAQFSSEHVASLADGAWVREGRTSLHATSRPLGHKLGGHATLFSGSTEVNGTQVSVFGVQWRRGSTLAVVMTIGRGASTSQAEHLATLQDVKLTSYDAK